MITKVKTTTKTLIFCTILLCMTSIFSRAAQSAEKRSTSINFEDELVEGINRKPLDSVNQLTEIDPNQRKHLYHKRAGFVDRDRLALEDMKLKH